MTHEVTKINQAEIVSNTQQQTWNADQVALLKRTYAKGATDDELKLYEYQCQRTGLDPFNRQIYFRKQQGKGGTQIVFITAIDGYRSIADKTGLYAGNDDYIFDGKFTEYDHIQKANGNPPTTATATVYKIVHGQRVSFKATTRWQEYYPGDAQGFMWKKMPYLMLGKTAEALALRKAFPSELGGVYTKEEMDQADTPRQQAQPQQQRPVNGNDALKQKIQQNQSPGPGEDQGFTSSDEPGGSSQPNVEENSSGSFFRVQAIGPQAYEVKDALEERGYSWAGKIEGQGKALTRDGLSREEMDTQLEWVAGLNDGITIKAYDAETGECVYQ